MGNEILEREVQDKNLLQRLIGVIISPTESFKEINQKPRFVLAMFILAILNVIFVMANFNKIKDFTLLSLEKLPQATPQVPNLEGFMTASIAVGMIFGAFIVPFIIWIIEAALLKFLTQFTGDEGAFKNIFAVAVFAWFPAVLGQAVKAIIIAMSKVEDVAYATTSLALLLPKGNSQNPVFTLLSKIDFFTIWSLVLLTIGTGIVFKISNKKAGAMVFGIWALGVLITVGTSAVFPKQAGF